MSYQIYYQNEFRSDFGEILTAAGRMQYGQHAFDKPSALQPLTVSTENPIVKSWPESKRNYFAVALFYTVLVDQVCYTYFRSHYERFQELTLYPKFIGNCLTLCYHNMHPLAILQSVGSGGASFSSVDDDQIKERQEIALDALPTMEAEVKDFFDKHMPELSGQEFWALCLREIKFRK